MNLMSSVKLMESRGIFQQQNGVVERKNRTFQEEGITMINEAKLLDGYWREAVYTTVYV